MDILGVGDDMELMAILRNKRLEGNWKKSGLCCVEEAG